MFDSQQVKALVAEQLAMIEDAARADALCALLLPEPRLEVRAWDYGAPDERYPYWVVAEARERSILLVYCEQGFGPEFPWGFLFIENDPRAESLGMDAQWNWYLEEAFVRSGLWPGRLGPDELLHLPPEQRFGSSSRPEA
jgi:hypothetical protein